MACISFVRVSRVGLAIRTLLQGIYGALFRESSLHNHHNFSMSLRQSYFKMMWHDLALFG